MKSNILVVDDTRDNLRLLANMLTEQGYKVRPAPDGRRALISAQSKPPDLILLDIMMPNMDGYEVCKHLKADERTKDIPIIFLSALHETTDKVKAFSVGGIDYITKPFQAEEVLARVKTHLELAMMRKRLQAQNTELNKEIIEHKRTKEALQRAKELAEAANQAKSVFLSNMSHELRSPLTAILGFTQVMDRSASLTQEHHENVRIIRRSGEHLLTLINQVLDLSKIEAGHITLEKNAVQLQRLLHDMKDMFSLKAKKKGLQLLFDQREGIPDTILTDEVKLRQVLINLLNNAVKFTEKGMIHISVHTEAQAPATENCILSFTIEDTGPGIASEEMDQLFEAFEQTQSGRRIQEGTGLGLAISRKFARLMGGDIQVTSTIGKGSCFKFHLQTHTAGTIQETSKQAPSQNRVLQPQQRTADGSRFRLLVADDDNTNRQLLIKLLAPLECDVREAKNGKQALEIWEAWHPHLIWMDIRMPVMNGYDATMKIKELIRKRSSIPDSGVPEIHTKIIALTASSFEEERLAIMASGCDDYLRKPFQDFELFELLHTHLDMKCVAKEDNNETHVPPKRPQSSAALNPKALAALPPEFVERLKQGVEEVNVTMLLESIEKIRQHDTAIADVLTQLVNDFEYDTISQWLTM